MTSPYYETFLGIETRRDDAGNPFCTFEPGNTALARKGVMHGGAVASLLEAAGFACLRAALDARQTEEAPLDFEPLTVTVDYLRPGITVRSYAQGKIIKLGGRSASVHVEAWNEDRSKPVAAATMAMLIRPGARA